MASDRPIKHGRVALVLEAEVDVHTPPEWVRIIVSQPGREGTTSKVWMLNRGQFEPSVWDDFEAYVFSLLSAFGLGVIGVQGVLPMG